MVIKNKFECVSMYLFALSPYCRRDRNLMRSSIYLPAYHFFLDFPHSHKPFLFFSRILAFYVDTVLYMATHSQRGHLYPVSNGSLV